MSSKPNVGRKRKTPPKPIDLFSVVPKKNGPAINLVPPIPVIPPPLKNDILTPNRLRSPHDTTKIIVNGKPIHIDKLIDERINGEENIKPLTPPPIPAVNGRSPEIQQHNLSPNNYIDNNIRIMETPKENIEDIPLNTEPEENESPNQNISEAPKKSISEIVSSIPMIPSIPKIPVVEAPKPEPEQKAPESIPSIPVSMGKPEDKPKVVPSGNMKSLFPTFNRNANRSSISDFINNVNHSPETVADEEEEEIEKQAFSPVNIPYPVFNTTNIRATSPIQTIGAKSPGPLNIKPVFTENGKSSTPLRTQAMTPHKPASVKASTPPPLFRSPRIDKENDIQEPEHISENPENTQNNNEEELSDDELKILLQQYMKYQNSQGGGETPKAPNHQGGYYEQQYHQEPVARVSNRPNYSRITKQQETFLRQEFKVKFGILRSTYPQWEVVEPDNTLTLDQIHDLYDHYLKQIMISRESGNYKTYMVIFLMVIEVIGVKFLKLNMSGYTMSQLRIMNRYDALFIELGEKYLVSSGSNWPVEARIVMMMLFNAVIFLVVRYLCSWMGMEGIADTLQNMIDNMLNGPSMISQNSGPIGSSNPIPDPLGPSAQNGAASENTGGGNTIDKIADMFSGFMSKNSGGITEKIAELGTMFTNKTQNNNTANKKKVEETTKSKEKERERNRNGKKINKKKLFDD